jgi:hypothetical protein
MRRALAMALMLSMALAGCDAVAPAAPTLMPVVAVKQLATVEIPPTLNAAERAATRAALPTTPTAPPPTLTPTVTPYIGVFLGEARPDSANVAPIVEALPTESSLETVGEGGIPCALPIDPAFGDGWQRNPVIPRALGCAIQVRFGFAGDVQVFQRGVMYRRRETGEVWAVRPGSVEAGEFWYVGQPPTVSASGLLAPEGLRVPSDAFGGVWLSDSRISEGLGYAVTPEQAADLNIQRFEGGTLFLDVTVDQVFALLVDGSAYGPY